MSPTLGDKVTFDMADVLGRYSDPLPDGHPARHGYLKRWRANNYAQRGDTRTGVIVGVRTLANGVASWPYSDEPIVFYPEEHFTAYLVAFNLRNRPVYLMPDSVTPVPTDRGAVAEEIAQAIEEFADDWYDWDAIVKAGDDMNALREMASGVAHDTAAIARRIGGGRSDG